MAKRGIGLAVAALLVYIVGGAATFGGIALLLLVGQENLWGWGDGRSLGYLFICTGLALTIAGVLLMRIFRNRDLA